MRCFQSNRKIPFDTKMFTDLDFTSSEVTDQQVYVENDQNEINKPVQDNQSRTPLPSILELSCPGSNQQVQLEEPIAQGTHSDRTKSPSYCEQPPPRTPYKYNQQVDVTLDNDLSPISRSKAR